MIGPARRKDFSLRTQLSFHYEDGEIGSNISLIETLFLLSNFYYIRFRVGHDLWYCLGFQYGKATQ